VFCPQKLGTLLAVRGPHFWYEIECSGLTLGILSYNAGVEHNKNAQPASIDAIHESELLDVVEVVTVSLLRNQHRHAPVKHLVYIDELGLLYTIIKFISDDAMECFKDI
jgi:hypothetical protein